MRPLRQIRYSRHDVALLALLLRGNCPPVSGAARIGLSPSQCDADLGRHWLRRLVESVLDPELETQKSGTDPHSLQDHCLAGVVHLS